MVFFKVAVGERGEFTVGTLAHRQRGLAVTSGLRAQRQAGQTRVGPQIHHAHIQNGLRHGAAELVAAQVD